MDNVKKDNNFINIPSSQTFSDTVVGNVPKCENLTGRMYETRELG
jgi:hypothetical protein